MSRRRWVVRPRPDAIVRVDTASSVTVGVHDGKVHISVEGLLAMAPADVSRVRQALAEAQAVALIERGTW